ncbi:MAG TPA: response regulator [Chloroflexi bacterium]|nr:response regulator [Chloroflexota bacterium]
MLVIKDVTREREIQTQLQQQERLAAVGQLAAGIAHDFNNIMAVIVLYAQIAARSSSLSERDRERMAVINQQAQHAARLIQQILDFSRRAVLERRPLDLLPLLKEQVKLLQRTLPEHIEITMAYEPDDYTVNADPTRMQQMITNLAVNARDAMPHGGVLRLGLERVTVERDSSPPLPELNMGEWVRLTVSDTGTGISPDALPHIFEPFFTTKSPGEGSGLGLAQVHGIVGQHGGQIGVETQVGEGTTFSIYLPTLAAHPPELLRGDVSITPQGHGEVVLVVEDNAALRTALVVSLEQWNYQALEAANGQEALALMAQQAEQIALVVSDVVMPGLGGIALFHTLRERGWQTPVILLTGHPMDKELDELRAHGLIAWLLKPPSLERLARAVADALHNSPHQG